MHPSNRLARLRPAPRDIRQAHPFSSPRRAAPWERPGEGGAAVPPIRRWTHGTETKTEHVDTATEPAAIVTAPPNVIDQPAAEAPEEFDFSRPPERFPTPIRRRESASPEMPPSSERITPRTTAPMRRRFRPMVAFNRAFDIPTYALGPAGRWLRGDDGRATLGWAGIVLLLVAAAWVAFDLLSWM